MKFLNIIRVGSLFILFCCPLIKLGYSQDIKWQKLEKGLELAQLSKGIVYNREQKSCEPDVYILKIDPDFFDFRLLSASEHQGQRKTLKAWIEGFDLVCGINASMFWKDLETSAGYMKNFDHINNDLIHPEYNAFFCFNPQKGDLPEIKLVDRANEPDWQKQIEEYATVIQNYRMISSKHKNVWKEDGPSYSVAAIGTQKWTKEVLFIFSQRPRTIHELNSILLDSSVQISACMFVEGGPTAGLYIKTKTLEQGWYGFSSKTLWSGKPETFNKIPNVIGVERKE